MGGDKQPSPVTVIPIPVLASEILINHGLLYICSHIEQ